MNRFKSIVVGVLVAVVVFGGIQVVSANSHSLKPVAPTKAPTAVAPTAATTNAKCRANNKDGNKVRDNNKDGQKNCGGGSPPPSGEGLNIYFKNEAGTTTGITRTDFTTSTCNTQVTNVDFSWAGGPSGCNSDGFTGFATGTIIWPGTTGTSEAVTFYSSSDDGSFVVLDGATIIDSWVEQGAAFYNATSSAITKTAGNVYPFKAYFHENSGVATWRLFWSYSGESTTVIPASAFSSTCALGGTCVVGNTGLGGGKVFYVAATTFTCGPTLTSTCRYLEAAPSGWSVANAPSPSACNAWVGTLTSDPLCAWSGNTTQLVTTATAIGTGYKNSIAIILEETLPDGRAATASRAYEGGGSNDWFLPSKDELNELCKYAKMQTTGTSTSCVWSLTLRSGFTGDRYWSSSEDGANTAWYWGFGDGASGITGKNNSGTYVRPVRAF